MGNGIARFFVHDIVITRWLGEGTDEPVFAEPESPVQGFWDDHSKYVRGDNGETSLSNAQVYLPLAVGRIPLGSYIERGPDKGRVIDCRVHEVNGKIRGVPEHVEVSLG